jgi:endonuclease/exonuclease/phosphatase family metal-dependent hydrolase
MKPSKRLSLVAVATLLGCSDGATPSASTTLTIDSLNVGLAGAFIPFEAERRAAIGPAVAALPSDVVCLQEVWREEDKDIIEAAVRARFPHIVRTRHDLTTPVTTDIDPMCDVPPAPTTAPCAAPALRTALDEGLRCLSTNCSTMPGNDMGQTTSTSCATSMCIGQVGALITSPEPDALRCYGCLASSLPTETFGAMRTACQSDPNAGLAFGGRNGVMILSKHPLSDVQTLVIPGTWNRRVITRATATLPNARRVTVYCNHLTPQFDSTAFPYTGRHGCGRVGREGWATEQLAQARRLVQWVNEGGAQTPTVVLGDFNTSPASTGVDAEAVETYNYLRAQLTPAVPQGYQPTCTYCPANALNEMRTVPVWIDHIFIKNLAATAVRSFERTFVEPSVTVPSAPGRVNVSDHYGVRAVITLP